MPPIRPTPAPEQERRAKHGHSAALRSSNQTVRVPARRLKQRNPHSNGTRYKVSPEPEADFAEKVGPRTTAALLEKGVISRAMPQGDILGFAAPLCLTREEADTFVAATKDAVEAVTATL